MTNAFIPKKEVVKLEPAESTEWVRGNDAALLAWLSPLVRRQSVLLDFSEVVRIDAAGLSVLIALYREAGNAGHSFAVSNPAAHVREILAVVGLDRILVAGGGESLPAPESCDERNAA